MRESKHYSGAGIYCLFNVMDNVIYIGASDNIANRFSQHRANFKKAATINSMYQEPIENFVFLVLRKMTHKEFQKYGNMFEQLFIASALKDGMKLYNVINVRKDVTGTVLFAFDMYDAIKKTVKSATGSTPCTIGMMSAKTRRKLLDRLKEA